MQELVHPRERSLFVVCLVVSVLIYAALAFSRFGIAVVAALVLVRVVLHGWSMGQIRGNAVRVTASQFPDLHRVASELASRLELRSLPAMYVLESGGALNAFATKFLRRDFVILYSDVLEVAYEHGEDEVAFVVAHELAHVKRRHVLWQWLLTPAAWIPGLGHAYSRACEFTCDRMAWHVRPAGAVRGLLLLAAGKRLYRAVDAAEFASQTAGDRGFWISFTEFFSSHPRLPRRVAAVRDFAHGARSLDDAAYAEGRA